VSLDRFKLHVRNGTAHLLPSNVGLVESGFRPFPTSKTTNSHKYRHAQPAPKSTVNVAKEPRYAQTTLGAGDSTALMFAARSREEDSRSRDGYEYKEQSHQLSRGRANGPWIGYAAPTDPERQYNEEEVHRISRGLQKDDKIFWSENPRLYMILKHISAGSGTSWSQVSNPFINMDITDVWLPIPSTTVLDQLFGHLDQAQVLRLLFVQSQLRVCSKPSDFELGPDSRHGHFSSASLTRSLPFVRLYEKGEGHIGRVHEIRSSIDGKVYAIKTIRRLLLYDFKTAHSRVRSFRRELHVLKRINHVHCVKLVSLSRL
jgi:hypothetical protein